VLRRAKLAPRRFLEEIPLAAATVARSSNRRLCSAITTAPRSFCWSRFGGQRGYRFRRRRCKSSRTAGVGADLKATSDSVSPNARFRSADVNRPVPQPHVGAGQPGRWLKALEDCESLFGSCHSATATASVQLVAQRGPTRSRVRNTPPLCPNVFPEMKGARQCSAATPASAW